MYLPEEDSYFLVEILREYLKNKNLRVLDLGTGSGIISEVLIEEGVSRENITASDIDEKVVRKVRKKFGIEVIKSDLFKNKKFSGKKFDLIVFNPPYLPSCRYDKEKDVTGGKKGDETILRFLKQVKNYLTKNGKILLLLSSLTPRKRINEILEKNFKKKKVAEKKLFFEKLEIFLIEKL